MVENFAARVRLKMKRQRAKNKKKEKFYKQFDLQKSMITTIDPKTNKTLTTMPGKDIKGRII